MSAKAAPAGPRSTHAQAAARAALQQCVHRCADARDERGRWRAEQACMLALQGGEPRGVTAADTAAAAAARALGRFVAQAAAAAQAELGVPAP